jgi:hypothetical protein
MTGCGAQPAIVIREPSGGTSDQIVVVSAGVVAGVRVP